MKISRFFRVSKNTTIPITIEDCGNVNIGATGTISPRTFVRLAAAVLTASNTQDNGCVGFPVGENLEEYK